TAGGRRVSVLVAWAAAEAVTLALPVLVAVSVLVAGAVMVLPVRRRDGHRRRAVHFVDELRCGGLDLRADPLGKVRGLDGGGEIVGPMRGGARVAGVEIGGDLVADGREPAGRRRGERRVATAAGPARAQGKAEGEHNRRPDGSRC